MWAKNNFDAWTRSRQRLGGECIPDRLLESYDANLVYKWLCCFVTEMRKTDGSVYPPATLKSIISGFSE